MKVILQHVAALDTPGLSALRGLARRSGPRIPADMARLEQDGLVRFVRETKRGTTWYAITPLGRTVLKILAKEIGGP